MRTTEIHNIDSEAFVLADVADMLAARHDDRTTSRLLNRVDWLAVGADDIQLQKDGRDLIRADGRFGRPDALVYVDVDPTHVVGDYQPLWNLRLDEATTIVFRRWVQGGREVIGALWTYWESDLPAMVPTYRDDLDVDAVGPEVARYNRGRDFDQLLHVPIYDDSGFIVMPDEAAFDGETLFDHGVVEVDSAEVIAYKAQVIQARAYFGSPEDAQQYRAGLEPIRFRTERERKAEAMRMSLPGGQTRPQSTSRTLSIPARPQRRTTSVVRTPEPPAKRGFWARLLGR